MDGSVNLRTNVDKNDNGIVEVMRDILLMGTKGIDEKTLISDDYRLEGVRKTLLLKSYPGYTVCYKKRSDGLYDLMAVAKR